METQNEPVIDLSLNFILPALVLEGVIVFWMVFLLLPLPLLGFEFIILGPGFFPGLSDAWRVA